MHAISPAVDRVYGRLVPGAVSRYSTSSLLIAKLGPFAFRSGLPTGFRGQRDNSTLARLLAKTNKPLSGLSGGKFKLKAGFRTAAANNRLSVPRAFQPDMNAPDSASKLKFTEKCDEAPVVPAKQTQVQYLIAYDWSGSTLGVAAYHQRAQHVVAELPSDAASVILKWNTEHRVITRTELAEINENRRGEGGTESNRIAQYVREIDFHGHLIIISDGEVDSRSVDACACFLGHQWNFESVTAHLIGPNINMSVPCPFTRVSPYAVYTYRPIKDFQKELSSAMTLEEVKAIDVVHTVSNVSNYLIHADAIERAVVMRTMGTMGDPAWRDAILKMKQRMVSALASAKSASGTVADLTAALNAGQTETAIESARLLTDEYYNTGDQSGTDTKTWGARINRLVSLCEGALRSTFDLSNIDSAISSDRMRRARHAGPTPRMAVPVVATSTQPVTEENEFNSEEFVCPETFDDAVDVMLLVFDHRDGGQPVLAGFDKDVVNDMLNCPLNLFHHPEVMQRLIDKLDGPISLQSYRDLDARDSPSSRPIAGGICLGSSDAHCESTNWVLSHALTGGRLGGNIDLWFACIWLLVEQGHIPRLNMILPQLRQHMQYRLRSRSTFLSLTGLPEFPSTRVPLGVAAWYVFASSVFGMPPSCDVLRCHMSHLKQLKELVVLSGYQLPTSVDQHVNRLVVMLSMLGWVKKDRFRLPNLMLALQQRCLRVDVSAIGAKIAQSEFVQEFIPLDGAPSKEQIELVYSLLPKHFRVLDVKTLISLSALVDPSKSASDIELKMQWQPLAADSHAPIVAWGSYGLDDMTHAEVRICVATCRPFYLPSCSSEEIWKVISERNYGPVDKQLSSDAHFGNFVRKFGQYPNRDEFATYLNNRVVLKDQSSMKALPAGLEAMMAMVFVSHKPVLAVVPDPTEFARRYLASVTRDVRVQLESAERAA